MKGLEGEEKNWVMGWVREVMKWRRERGEKRKNKVMGLRKEMDVGMEEREGRKRNYIGWVWNEERKWLMEERRSKED